MSSSDLPPSLDPVASARWAARARPASAWLHEEVARRMQERLDVIRLQPQAWADWEPLRGGLQAHQALRMRYPQAALWQVLQMITKSIERTKIRWHSEVKIKPQPPRLAEGLQKKLLRWSFLRKKESL